MRTIIQRPLKFINKCGCIVDLDLLEKAMLWHTEAPLTQKKTIYLTVGYPAVTITTKSVHVHRLIRMFLDKTKYSSDIHVHHKDENKLNSHPDNLEAIPISEHLRNHNTGKKRNSEWCKAISEGKKNRPKRKSSPRKTIPLDSIKDMLINNESIQKISKHLNCARSTVLSRIKNSEELSTIQKEKSISV